MHVRLILYWHPNNECMRPVFPSWKRDKKIYNFINFIPYTEQMKCDFKINSLSQFEKPKTQFRERIASLSQIRLIARNMREKNVFYSRGVKRRQRNMFCLQTEHNLLIFCSILFYFTDAKKYFVMVFYILLNHWTEYWHLLELYIGGLQWSLHWRLGSIVLQWQGSIKGG